MLRHYFRLCITGVLVLLIAGCDQAPDNKMTLQQAQSLVPIDKDLNALYQRSCIACHANPDTQAPLVGDLKAWQPRLDKGMDTLLSNVVEGYAGMPPFGMCMDCSEGEFKQLIDFMAQAGPLSKNNNKDH